MNDMLKAGMHLPNVGGMAQVGSFDFPIEPLGFSSVQQTSAQELEVPGTLTFLRQPSREASGFALGSAL